MEYSRKSSLKWILLYIILGVVLYGAVYYFFFYKMNDDVYVPQNDQTQNSNSEELYLKDFPDIKRYELYSVARQMVLEKGWNPMQSETCNSNFPEFTSCGSGYDAVYYAEFVKEGRETCLLVGTMPRESNAVLVGNRELLVIGECI